MSELDLLRRLGADITPPPFDALRATARQRTMRNRAATLATTTAVAVTVGAAVLLSGPSELGTAPEPVEPTPTETVRPLTYGQGSTLHYGEADVTFPATLEELDLVDGGVLVRTTDGTVWFSNGETRTEVGAVGAPGPEYDSDPSLVVGWIASGNTGSVGAWFDFTSGGLPDLVVYDARLGAVSARVPVEMDAPAYLRPTNVTDRYVYWSDDSTTDDREPNRRFDIATGEQAAVSRAAHQADLASLGRARLIEVDHGGPVLLNDGAAWNFDVQGGRIRPSGMQPLILKDALTGVRFGFAAPEGFAPRPTVWLTQWLDDDTVILFANLDRTGGEGNDLLSCEVGGACTVIVQSTTDFVVPELDG